MDLDGDPVWDTGDFDVAGSFELDDGTTVVVVTGEAEDGRSFLVRALDVSDGSSLWERTLPASKLPSRRPSGLREIGTRKLTDGTTVVLVTSDGQYDDGRSLLIQAFDIDNGGARWATTLRPEGGSDDCIVAPSGADIDDQGRGLRWFHDCSSEMIAVSVDDGAIERDALPFARPTHICRLTSHRLTVAWDSTGVVAAIPEG